jgi:hypothetical protein
MMAPRHELDVREADAATQSLFLRGIELFEKHDLRGARDVWSRAARLGHISAMRNFAVFLSLCGVNADVTSDPTLYLCLAAVAGDVVSNAALGMYFVFEDRDLARARTYLGLALETSSATQTLTKSDIAILRFFKALTRVEQGSQSLRDAFAAGMVLRGRLPPSLAQFYDELKNSDDCVTTFERAAANRHMRFSGADLNFMRFDLTTSSRRVSTLAEEWFREEGISEASLAVLLRKDIGLLAWADVSKVSFEVIVLAVEAGTRQLQMLATRLGRERFVELLSVKFEQRMSNKVSGTLETLLRTYPWTFWSDLAKKESQIYRDFLISILPCLTFDTLDCLFDEDATLYVSYVESTATISANVAVAALRRPGRLDYFLEVMGLDRVFAVDDVASTQEAIVNVVRHFQRSNKGFWASLREKFREIDSYVRREASVPRRATLQGNRSLELHCPGQTEGVAKVSPRILAQRWLGDAGVAALHEKVYDSRSSTLMFAESAFLCRSHFTTSGQGENAKTFEGGYVSTMAASNVVELDDRGRLSSSHLSADRESTIVLASISTRCPFDVSDPQPTNHTSLIVFTRESPRHSTWKLWICEDGRDGLDVLVEIVRQRFASVLTFDAAHRICKVLPSQYEIALYTSEKERNCVGLGFCYLLVCLGSYLILLLATTLSPSSGALDGPAIMEHFVTVTERAFTEDLGRLREHGEEHREVVRTLHVWLLGGGWHRIGRRVWRLLRETSLELVLRRIGWAEDPHNSKSQSFYDSESLGITFHRKMQDIKRDRHLTEEKLSEDEASLRGGETLSFERKGRTEELSLSDRGKVAEKSKTEETRGSPERISMSELLQRVRRLTSASSSRSDTPSGSSRD